MGKDQNIRIIDHLNVIVPRQQIVEEIVIF